MSMVPAGAVKGLNPAGGKRVVRIFPVVGFANREPPSERSCANGNERVSGKRDGDTNGPGTRGEPIDGLHMATESPDGALFAMPHPSSTRHSDPVTLTGSVHTMSVPVDHKEQLVMVRTAKEALGATSVCNTMRSVKAVATRPMKVKLDDATKFEPDKAVRREPISAGTIMPT